MDARMDGMGREGSVRGVAGKSSVDGNNHEIGVVRLARLNAEGVGWSLELEVINPTRQIEKLTYVVSFGRFRGRYKLICAAFTSDLFSAEELNVQS